MERSAKSRALLFSLGCVGCVRDANGTIVKAMTREQIAEAQTLSREWLEGHR